MESGHYGEVSTITIAPSVSAVTPDKAPVRCPSLTGLMLIRSAISHEVMRDYRCQVLIVPGYWFVAVYISSGLM
eukprot:scaffold212604_cov46-Cyclotella_meneghiniana.AAC.1